MKLTKLEKRVLNENRKRLKSLMNLDRVERLHAYPPKEVEFYPEDIETRIDTINRCIGLLKDEVNILRNLG